MKKTVLFISQPIFEDKICAIGISGKLYADAFLLSDKYNVLHYNAINFEEIQDLYQKHKPHVIIYMFCSRTTAWMTDATWKKNIPCKHLVIDADVTQKSINDFSKEKFHNFDGLISLDPSLDVQLRDDVFLINHIMPKVNPSEYIETGVVKIGFHGSPTFNKGIIELVDIVQNEFDEAQINFHCPLHFPNNGHTPNEFMSNINAVKKRITKTGIKFSLTSDIISNQELVDRLSQNTINCYFNQDSPYNLTGSAIHTALAAKRPIAIKRSRASKAYLNTNPSICIEDNSLKDIISFGFSPLESIYEKFTPENVCNDFEKIISKVLMPSGFSFSL